MTVLQKMEMMNQKIVLVGGGGHALSLLEAVPDPSSVAGYLDLKPVDSMTADYLGNDSDAPGFFSLGAAFHIAFVYAGMPGMKARRRLIELYSRLAPRFASIIANSAIITPGSSVGEGAAVLNGAIVNRASIAPHAIINSGAIIEHDSVIGDNSFVGPGTVIGGGTTVGSDCFIGLGARLKNGITIAPSTVIGMGAVVTHDISEPGIYHGFPLRKYHPKR